MKPASSPVLTPTARDGGIVFAPGEKFFVRRVPLISTGDAAEQVALAVEGFSPFPAGQLFYGFRTNSGRTEALVFAAYRKNFSAEEVAGWSGAAVVLPTFAVWLGARTVPAAGISVRDEGGRCEVIAWDGRSELPAAIVVRAVDGREREALLTEIRDKAGMDADSPVSSVRSALEITREKRELILRLSGGGMEAHFDEAALTQADIRDKAVLTERRQTLRRETMLWRGFAVILTGLAACLVLELGMLATRLWMAGKQNALNAQAPVVARIEQAQGMAKRLEEISTQRLLPFEMLAELNDKRPKTVEFTSVTTKGLWQLDIRGQAANPADTTIFESDVRRLAGIDRVEVLEKNTRDGVTVVHYEITFKPGWQQIKGGGV